MPNQPDTFPDKKVALALPHATGSVFSVNNEMLSVGIAASRTSPRLRIILPIHRSAEDGVQRMLNFLQPGTYIPPHHHAIPGFSETICVIRGQIIFVEFDTDGNIVKREILTEGQTTCLLDLIGPIIHSFVCLVPDTIILEIKKGPYLGAGDKEFAPWAPREGEPAAPQYLAKLAAGLSLK